MRLQSSGWLLAWLFRGITPKFSVDVGRRPGKMGAVNAYTYHSTGKERR